MHSGRFQVTYGFKVGDVIVDFRANILCCLLKSKYILVAYGSQTGNAESIAQDFLETIQQLGFHAKCMTLNKTKNINFQEEVSVLVIGAIS